MSNKHLNRSSIPQTNRYVIVNAEHGYGSKPFPVVGEDDRHYTLKDENGKTFQIYKVHCRLTRRS